jgi:hypothetical protein
MRVRLEIKGLRLSMAGTSRPLSVDPPPLYKAPNFQHAIFALLELDAAQTFLTDFNLTNKKA